MSVGPNLSTGVQSAYPVDVVPYGGLLKAAISDTTFDAWEPAAPFLTVPAGQYVRVHSICDPSLVGAAAGNFWAIGGTEGSPTILTCALATPARPFVLIGGMIFDPSTLYVMNQNSPNGSDLYIIYDSILPPSIQ